MDVVGSFPCGALDGVGCFAWMVESRCSFSTISSQDQVHTPRSLAKRAKHVFFVFVIYYLC